MAKYSLDLDFTFDKAKFAKKFKKFSDGYDFKQHVGDIEATINKLSKQTKKDKAWDDQVIALMDKQKIIDASSVKSTFESLKKETFAHYEAKIKDCLNYKAEKAWVNKLVQVSDELNDVPEKVRSTFDKYNDFISLVKDKANIETCIKYSKEYEKLVASKKDSSFDEETYCHNVIDLFNNIQNDIDPKFNGFIPKYQEIMDEATNAITKLNKLHGEEASVYIKKIEKLAAKQGSNFVNDVTELYQTILALPDEIKSLIVNFKTLENFYSTLEEYKKAKKFNDKISKYVSSEMTLEDANTIVGFEGNDDKLFKNPQIDQYITQKDNYYDLLQKAKDFIENANQAEKNKWIQKLKQLQKEAETLNTIPDRRTWIKKVTVFLNEIEPLSDDFKPDGFAVDSLTTMQEIYQNACDIDDKINTLASAKQTQIWKNQVKALRKTINNYYETYSVQVSSVDLASSFDESGIAFKEDVKDYLLNYNLFLRCEKEAISYIENYNFQHFLEELKLHQQTLEDIKKLDVITEEQRKRFRKDFEMKPLVNNTLYDSDPSIDKQRLALKTNLERVIADNVIVKLDKVFKGPCTSEEAIKIDKTLIIEDFVHPLIQEAYPGLSESLPKQIQKLKDEEAKAELKDKHNAAKNNVFRRIGNILIPIFFIVAFFIALVSYLSSKNGLSVSDLVSHLHIYIGCGCAAAAFLVAIPYSLHLPEPCFITSGLYRHCMGVFCATIAIVILTYNGMTPTLTYVCLLAAINSFAALLKLIPDFNSPHYYYQTDFKGEQTPVYNLRTAPYQAFILVFLHILFSCVACYYLYSKTVFLFGAMASGFAMLLTLMIYFNHLDDHNDKKALSIIHKIVGYAFILAGAGCVGYLAAGQFVTLPYTLPFDGLTYGLEIFVVGLFVVLNAKFGNKSNSNYLTTIYTYGALILCSLSLFYSDIHYAYCFAEAVVFVEIVSLLSVMKRRNLSRHLLGLLISLILVAYYIVPTYVPDIFFTKINPMLVVFVAMVLYHFCFAFFHHFHIDELMTLPVLLFAWYALSSTNNIVSYVLYGLFLVGFITFLIALIKKDLFTFSDRFSDDYDKKKSKVVPAFRLRCVIEFTVILTICVVSAITLFHGYFPEVIQNALKSFTGLF